MIVYFHSSLSLWGAMKKKPLSTLRNAHGTEVSSDPGVKFTVPDENWITAVAALRNTDLVASGKLLIYTLSDFEVFGSNCEMFRQVKSIFLINRLYVVITQYLQVCMNK